MLDLPSKVSHELIDQPEVIELDEEYFKNAGRVAQMRAAQAAIRLGGVMRMGAEYHTWLKRYRIIKGRNGKVPRGWWLEEWEKQAILDFHEKHPLEGCRRLIS